jgi:hypothetical protein
VWSPGGGRAHQSEPIWQEQRRALRGTGRTTSLLSKGSDTITPNSRVLEVSDLVAVVRDLVLGLVIEQPRYGYALKAPLEERFGDSGFAESGIYSALESLHGDGLIQPRSELTEAGVTPRDLREESSRHVRGRQRDARTWFGATAEGLAHFDHWMAQSAPPSAMRDDLWLKLALCRRRHVPRMVELFLAREQLCLDLVGSLQQEAQSVTLSDCTTIREVAETGRLEERVGALENQIGCLRKTRITLLRVADSDGGGRGRLHPL